MTLETRTVSLTELVAIWIANAVDGDCDLEDDEREPEAENDISIPGPVNWREDEDMEDEGVSPGFLHIDGAWRGMPA